MNNNNNANHRGTIFQRGNIMYVQNALVEEAFAGAGGSGYVLISYAVPGPGNTIFIELLRLNVDCNTMIANQLGVPLRLCDIKKGMWVDAEFSSAMTRSIPPQSRAFRITVQMEKFPVSVTVDRVVTMDLENQFLYTGDTGNIADQMRFVISDETVILNRNGNPIPLSAIQPGQVVKVEHAIFQTMSIPPQTPAFFVQVL